MRQIRTRALCIALAGGLAVAGIVPAFSARKSPAQSQDSTSTPKRVASESEGEKKFKQNCSRCHEAPQALSSRISGSVLRHMRVRASLSEQDEREILKFLNP